MAIPILLDLAVGGPGERTAPAGPAPVSLAASAEIATAAAEAGVAALRLRDIAGASRALDPSVVGAYLAGRASELGYLVDLPTSGNAPYNAARRLLSFDRATGGRAGVVLRAGGDDEVSRATAPESRGDDRARRWSEYGEILTRLWESFPRDALIADQHRGVVVDETLITAIDHDGQFYRVAGPLDGPSSVQGRPVVAATDLDVLSWDDIAGVADAVIVQRDQVAAASVDLAAALTRAGRARTEIALLASTPVSIGEDTHVAAVAAELSSWVTDAGVDGLVLAPTGGAEAVLATVRDLVPLLAGSRGSTLRATLGLPVLAGVAS
ncbi:LLM class flavin-dependent oxidoreductase [Nocardia aurantiaca]|uniref:LLM class flavin-dependent oxidoreductase n=1 Tax=Nocardia aurantiaca TaxID=2675850 RepID=A0A6I3L335_9NOCA|nr:LLM class flavin-dependent oxidoreductase [Nocardia aurantiaca]MTE15688.1 LLM class flavin-dependent oxidoreductase [Nocardia aurantiaca]